MLRSLPKEILISIRLTLVFALATGLIYPLVITGVGQVVFHDQANGSLVTNQGGQVVGSSLIGQWFDPTDTRYFHPRPSATVDPATGKALPYAGNNSAGSNLGPSSQTLISRVQAQVQQIMTTEKNIVDGVPVDMVTTSFSGLDPDISVANANLQVSRVANSRHLPVARVRQVVGAHTNDRQWGFLGEKTINVLDLNLALDAMHS